MKTREENKVRSFTTSKMLINALVALLREGNYVFRGVSRNNELLPNINRVFKNGKLRDMSQYEGELLQHFKNKYFQSY